MHKLVVFIKKDCPQCPLAKKVAKEVAKELGLKYEEVDVEKDMITALMYNVVSTPSIVFDEELLFRGVVPTTDELKREILKLMKASEEGK